MNMFAKYIAIALFAFGAFAMPAAAQDSADKHKNVGIAVVDIQALLKDSKAAQSIETQLATIRKNFQSEVEKEEKSLRDTEKGIVAQKDKLKEEELQAKAKEFQAQVAASQKKIQDRKNKLDKALQVAVSKLRAEIVKVVAEIADKNKLDLVLARTDVVIVSKDLDITPQVLDRINKDVTDIKVVVE